LTHFFLNKAIAFLRQAVSISVKIRAKFLIGSVVNPQLLVKSVTFSRVDRLVLQDVSFAAETGNIVYIKGPNGVGKSTLLRLITGSLSADSGEVIWQNGSTSQHARSQSLYLGHASGLKNELSVFENLTFYDQLDAKAGEQAIEKALIEVGLLNYIDTLVGKLSAGQKRRVGLARLLLTDKSLVILDEPFNALDKESVLWLEAQIDDLARQKNRLVLITSHQELTSINADKVVELTPCY